VIIFSGAPGKPVSLNEADGEIHCCMIRYIEKQQLGGTGNQNIFEIMPGLPRHSLR
jgi:hypothetical protein